MARILQACYVCLVAALMVRFLGPELPVSIGPTNPHDPPSLPAGTNRTVLVVGGGLAGLSAALELAERGYQVTVREAAPMLGGRLKSTEVDVLGETFRVDHGFHAWFYNYYTFKDVRQRLGINDNFQRWTANHFKFRNYKPEVLESKGTYPFNVIATLLKSPNFKVADLFTIIKVSIRFAYYNHDTVYHKYGNFTFDEWVKADQIPLWFADTILRPSVSVTFNEHDTLNAAEVMMYSHFFFTGDHRADNREIAVLDHRSAIFDPWERRLKTLKVKIQKRSPVTAFTFSKGTPNVTGISLESMRYDHVILATDISAVKSIFAETHRKVPNNPQVKCVNMRLEQLRIAPHYKVLRVWFDKLLDSGRPAILQTPEFHPVNLVVQYHLIEEKSRAWSALTGGSIVEFHLYAWKYGDVRDEEVWEVIAPTVRDIYPEIFENDFKVLASFVHSGDNFASFSTHLEHIRPTTTFAVECGIDNLYFAGDWLHTPYPSALMERAVSTGRVAANQVLAADHIRQATLLVTSNYGPGYI